MNSDPVRGFVRLRGVLGQLLGDVGPVAAVLGHDRQPGLGVLAERVSSPAGLASSSLAFSTVSSSGGRSSGTLRAGAVRGLDVGAVATHPQVDALGDRERGQLAGVDVAELGDQLLQALDVAAAEVEPGQLGVAVAPTAGDLVEHVLHPRGELVAHQPAEVLLEQPDHRERQPGRHQGRALLVDVAAVEDGADDRGVRRGPADLALLELADQRGLGVARRRLGLVAGGGRGSRR